MDVLRPLLSPGEDLLPQALAKTERMAALAEVNLADSIFAAISNCGVGGGNWRAHSEGYNGLSQKGYGGFIVLRTSDGRVLDAAGIVYELRIWF